MAFIRRLLDLNYDKPKGLLDTKAGLAIFEKGQEVDKALIRLENPFIGAYFVFRYSNIDRYLESFCWSLIGDPHCKEARMLVLDERIVKVFHRSAKKTKEYPHDYGEMRRLRMELQHLCGITELEALNVLTYRNTADYSCRYHYGVIPGRAEITASSSGGCN